MSFFAVLFLFFCGHNRIGQIPHKGHRRIRECELRPVWQIGCLLKLGELLLRDAVWVYNNWSSYDELSDSIPLTEELAMKEFGEILRLRKFGVHFDYYMMDAFWFAPDGGYRIWRTPNWPNGPDKWIAACKENGILPGMWFGTNALVHINAAPQWKDSVGSNGWTMSLSEGGFLPDFMNLLQYWYDRGIRMFKFDFVDFTAATPVTQANVLRERSSSRCSELLLKFIRCEELTQ